jgi:hypothetical protein
VTRLHRRKFLIGASALSLAVKGPSALSARPRAASPVDHGSGADEAQLEAEPIAARYQLTIEPVLHGTGPAYTPEFLLEDIQGIKSHRFTNFSRDVSGRRIGALATASAASGRNFPLLIKSSTPRSRFKSQRATSASHSTSTIRATMT